MTVVFTRLCDRRLEVIVCEAVWMISLFKLNFRLPSKRVWKGSSPVDSADWTFMGQQGAVWWQSKGFARKSNSELVEGEVFEGKKS